MDDKDKQFLWFLFFACMFLTGLAMHVEHLNCIARGGQDCSQFELFKELSKKMFVP